MIALVSPKDPRLKTAPGEPLLLGMIQGLAKTAGPGLSREVWLVLSPEGTPAGAICRTEAGLWATAGEAADLSEAAAFLAALGDLPGMADKRLAPLLPGRWERRPVLEYRGPQPEEPVLCAPSCMALADCSAAAGAIPQQDRDALYAELHLRIRRGAAQVVLVPDETGEPAAGGANLLGEESAVIGYLACRRDKQGRGYGTAALRAAVWAAMEQRKLPLLACRKELTAFYTARGFLPAGEVWEKRASAERSE